METATTTLTHGIQLAIAPVFLLTAVAALLGAVATRLARIIDRARLLEERLDAATVKDVPGAYRELAKLKRRGQWVNSAMVLLTLCGLFIGITVMALFLGETTALHAPRWISVSFPAGVICFILALLCFLAETLLASHTLRFGRPKKTPRT